jgi:iron-sulfur cluster repair protein YtfE (RIC family)
MDLTAPKSLLDLNKIHQELDALFFRHQVAILKADWPQAGLPLKIYEEALMSHLKEEEDILLPLYRERVTPIRGGDPEIFIQEHQKVDEWLKRIRLRISRLVPLPPPKDVIALLDDEAHFKKFMEHHSLREDRILYPELERVTSESEKFSLCRLLTFSVNAFADEMKAEGGRSS